MSSQLSTTVFHVSDDGTVIAKLPNGNKYEVMSPASGLRVGDIITVDAESMVYTGMVSDSGYEAGNLIGIIKEIDDDAIIASIDGSVRKVTNPLDKEIQEGYTVELTDAYSITSVAAQHTIKDNPLERDNSSSISDFRQSLDDDSDLTLDDFGGLTENHRQLLQRTELLLTKRDELAEVGVDIQMGALFYGPPGTGKTHFARILASLHDATFYRIRGPEIISAWVGDTEKLIRDLFEDASENEPSIIFFDEIDSIATDRSSESSRNFSQRLVAQLLSVIDGFDEEEHSVLLIAATNRIDEIDEALLRSGRFSWQVKFPVPDKGSRKAILEALIRNPDGQFSIADNVSDDDMQYIIDNTDGWTGAGLRELLNEAGVVCVEDGRTEIEYIDLRKGHERAARQEKQRGRE